MPLSTQKLRKHIIYFKEWNTYLRITNLILYITSQNLDLYTKASSEPTSFTLSIDLIYLIILKQKGPQPWSIFLEGTVGHTFKTMTDEWSHIQNKKERETTFHPFPELFRSDKYQKSECIVIFQYNTFLFNLSMQYGRDLNHVIDYSPLPSHVSNLKFCQLI